MRIIFITLTILLALTACTSSQAHPSIAPSPFITLTPSPYPTNTPSPTPKSSERSCSPEDFKTPSTPPDINQPETLIGFRPSRDWLPSNDWKSTHGTWDPEFDYSIQAYESSSQYLFVLEKRICRYNENRYPLHEIRDYILISDLNEDEIIIDRLSFTSGGFFAENIKERLNFKWEMHTIGECGNTEPSAIMIARYNLNEFPEKIEPGTQITVKAIKGWLPNPYTNEFDELDATGISCTISFHGL